MGFTLAETTEAIADAIPEREAIVSPTRRLSWRDLQLRSRRLAHLLVQAGLGCHRERDRLAPWESGQDHLALYLYNGHEYLEGMLGASKARVAPFNVNYRYVEEELRYLFTDARPRAIVFHSCFAPLLGRVLHHLPPMALLLQVDDGSGEALLPGAVDYEQALAGSSEAPVAARPSEDDLYILYTGGTTGMPKGVLWRQHDIFFAALGGRLPGTEPVGSVEELADRARGGGMVRILPAPPFMHGAAHWSAFMILHQGGTVCLPNNTRRLDPDDIWRTIERENVVSLTIVGDAFARPLIDQLRQSPSDYYDLSRLQILGSGGAILSPPLKQAFLEHLPHLMIFDGFGASETGAQGSTLTMAGSEISNSFRMDDHTVVVDETMTRRLQPAEAEIGWLARAGNVPLGYLGDEAKTRRTYPIIEGVRHAVPGDRAQLVGDGTIRVLGRDSVCINSGGEKIFAEEVEQALKRHPAVYDAVVTGTPSERWGEQVTAVVALRPGARASEEDLREAAAKEIARYKLPRAFVFVETVVRAPSGKPDYRWAKQTALAGLQHGA
jgi:acyl-CoA synthetase (AMP-forming)/AMP-acid ligase II